VQTPGGFIELDCGIGSFCQIRSHYGRAGAAEILRNLRAIWISHCHVEGLVRMLLERREIASESLLLCACNVVRAEVERIESLFGPSAFHIIYNNRLTRIETAGAVIDSFPVEHHCPGAMGCVLTVPGGARLAFSGDRIADGQFEKAVGSCDVLIHEGTFLSDIKARSREYGHSTFADATESATAMSAKWLFITHISKRVDLRSMVLPEQGAIVAFDHLSLEFERVGEGIRVAKEVFARAIEEDGEITRT
jgi:ribonuclease Z